MKFSFFFRYIFTSLTALPISWICIPTYAQQKLIPAYLNPSLPIKERVEDLISKMTPAEKYSQLLADAPAIPRLGIPAYSYRNECIHGYTPQFGFATVFPQVIGMAATWDPDLIKKEADAIAIEARANFNDYTSKHNGNSIMHEGISCYAPNINIVRDPRWGRNQETYGEDPFLTSRMSIAFIHGLQGNNPKYIKVMACAKHFAVHSGPEALRHSMNMTPPKSDLYNTYLKAFEADVKEGHVGSVMGAYSALYGTPDCANPFLLKEILRHQWGFDGFVVSDGGAITNIYKQNQHHYVKTPEDAAVVAIKAGDDLFSGNITDRGPGHYPERDQKVLQNVLQSHRLTEQEIDSALTHTLTARFRLGLFDPPAMVPWSKITMAQNDSKAHRELALKIAEESMVLLKNDGVLPLNKRSIKRIAVIGANGADSAMLLGNYQGRPSHVVTILEGIKQIAGSGIEVIYEKGSPLALKNDSSNMPTQQETSQAVTVAKSADVIIYVGGLNALLEGEQHRVNYKGFFDGDRTRIELPSVQENLLKKLYATGKPVIFVNCSGDAIAMPWEERHLAAIVQAWYPGEEGGTAVANVLFGKVNPSGRLPVTFYSATKELPPFTDYSMANRTYRYYTGKPLFAFGDGLSYTAFKYSNAKINAKDFSSNDTIRLSFKLKNIGKRDGDEVAQVYFKKLHASPSRPRLTLCGFYREHLKKGNSTIITMNIPIQLFRYWTTSQKKYMVKQGKYELLIGAASNDIRLRIPLRVNTKPGIK